MDHPNKFSYLDLNPLVIKFTQTVGVMHSVLFDVSVGCMRATSPWRTLSIRSCRTFCSDLA